MSITAAGVLSQSLFYGSGGRRVSFAAVMCLWVAVAWDRIEQTEVGRTVTSPHRGYLTLCRALTKHHNAVLCTPLAISRYPTLQIAQQQTLPSSCAVSINLVIVLWQASFVKVSSVLIVMVFVVTAVASVTWSRYYVRKK